jgi:hypothetical protein
MTTYTVLEKAQKREWRKEEKFNVKTGRKKECGKMKNKKYEEKRLGHFEKITIQDGYRHNNRKKSSYTVNCP